MLLILASTVVAQQRIKPPTEEAPRIVRETVLDDQGLQQWAPFKAQRCPKCHGQKLIECEFCKRLDSGDGCPQCEGDRKAPCNECFGTGTTWDPLELMPCACCAGMGMLPCGGCGSKGTHMVEGGGDKPKKCDACRGDRVFECHVCDGARHIPLVTPKKDVREDPLEDLRETRQTVEAVRAELADWKGEDRSTKAVQSFEKVLKPIRKELPAVKDIAKTMKEVLKGLDKARGWVGTTQKIADTQAEFRDRTIWMLDHTMLVLDRCIQRAEANQAVLANEKK